MNLSYNMYQFISKLIHFFVQKGCQMKEKIIKIIHKYGDIIYHLFNMVNQIKPERSN